MRPRQVPDVHTEAVVPVAATVPAPSRPPEAPGTGQRARISPAARKRALELHVETTLLRGTDRRRDHGGGCRKSRIVTPALSRSRQRGGAGMRAAIAAAMSRSKREIPHYYLTTAVDVTSASDWLAAHNAAVPVTERLLSRCCW